MFFFIGGVEDRPTLVDAGPYACPRCGAREAAVYRLDRYITFFFIPIFPISRGPAVLQCEACGYVEDEETAQMRQPGGGTDPLGIGTQPGSRTGGGSGSGAAAGHGGERAAGTRAPCHSCGAPLATEFRYCPYCGEAQGPNR
jgi:predicted RNA-binding Zn-ribbon protein involved in translation (DUF1610 family)